MGGSISAGMTVIADGSDSAEERIARCLFTDPAIGVIRHADAGYDEAKDAATRGLAIDARHCGGIEIGMTRDALPTSASPRGSGAALPAGQAARDRRHPRTATGRRRSACPRRAYLVERLNVSRMTVHRALRELKSEGVIVRVPGRGTFVSPEKPRSTLLETQDIAEEIRGRGSAMVCRVEALEEMQPPTGRSRPRSA